MQIRIGYELAYECPHLPMVLTLNVHYSRVSNGEGRGIPYVMSEIRQDQLSTPRDIDAWAERMAVAYGQLPPSAANADARP